MIVPCHAYETVGVVYVEVPKAGATSIKWALSPFKGGPPEPTEDIHRWTGYIEAEDVSHLYRWLSTRWSSYFRFTVLRDPIARFVSFYRWLPRDQQIDLERFILAGGWRDNIHAIPQTAIVGTDLARFDYIGRTEDMAEVQAVLREHLDRPVVVPWLNAAKAKVPEVSELAEAMLREFYAEDYDVLGAI